VNSSCLWNPAREEEANQIEDAKDDESLEEEENNGTITFVNNDSSRRISDITTVDDFDEDDFSTLKKPKFDKNQAECFKCGEIGHMKNECTQNVQNFNKPSNDDGCFKCGEVGHFFS